MSKKIPDHAEKVFSGIIFDVYHRQQELFDGSFTTFEGLKRKNGAVILPITETGKIIVIEDLQPNRQPKITVPTGSVEHNEEELKTADRELLEETGYKAENIELLGIESSVWQKIDFEIHYFLGLNCVKIQEQNLEPGEKIKTFKMGLEEFKEVLKDPRFDYYTKEFIEKHNILDKLKQYIK